MHLIELNLIAYAGALVLSLILIPLAIRAARALSLVDHPGLRKVHRVPVPHIGGVAIALAMTTAFIVVAILAPKDLLFARGDIGLIVTLLVAAFSLMILGFVDDIYNLPAKYKLLILIVASTVVWGAGGGIRAVTITGKDVVQFSVLSWPLTMLWLVGITVSINFIDGLDGLAGGIVAIASGVLAVGAAVAGFPLSTLLGLSLLGALTGFLAFNVHPAKIFMGDCGSMFIGFMLAGSCLLANHAIGSTRAMILPMLALSIPLLDTFFTLVRRGILQRRSLFAAERGHVHHRLLDIGLRHPHVVITLHAVTLAAAVVGMISIFGTSWAAIVSALAFAVLLLTLFRVSGSLRAIDTVKAIRRNRDIARENRRYQHAFYEMQLGFREIAAFDAWWEQVIRSAQSLEFAKIHLPLTRRDGSKTSLRWASDQEILAGADSMTAEIPIRQRRAGETMRIEVELAGSQFLEGNGHRLSLFSQLMGEFCPQSLPDRPNKQSRYPVADNPISGSSQMNGKAVPVESADSPSALGPFPGLRVAIVHDFLYTYAGAERVLEQLVDLFPHADLFSLFDFLPEGARGFIHNKTVRTSFIQRMPFARARHRLYLPLMPLAIEQLDVSGYDLVLSSSYIAAKGVMTRSDQLHICYCHSPARYAWEMQKTYLDQTGLMFGLKSFAARLLLHYIRTWDVHSAHGVDLFVTNSDFVGRRIQKRYRRNATTIYPPVATDRFALHEEKEDYYVTASRMVPYKRIDLIVEAFAKMPDRRLIVVGDGPEMAKIKALAGENVRLMGHEPFDRLRRHIQLARAFIFAAEEDFGIAPVEALACGTPVIAFNRGGVTETVIDGKSGVFFNEQTTASLITAIERFESLPWDAREIHQRAAQFSSRRFREQFTKFVKRQWAIFETDRIQRADAIGVDQTSRGTRQLQPVQSAEDARTNHDSDEVGLNVA